MKFHYLIRTSAALLLIATAGTAAALMATAGTAAAGECAIEYIRTACPGKEAESYSKCNGKQSCVLPEVRRERSSLPGCRVEGMCQRPPVNHKEQSGSRQVRRQGGDVGIGQGRFLRRLREAGY